MKTIRCINAIALAMVVLFCIVFPTTAVIQEMTLKGEITNVDIDNQTIYASFTQSYGCDYGTEGGDPVCEFSDLETAINSSTLALDPSMLTTMKTGDVIAVTTLGGEDGQWIAVAKITADENGNEVASDVWGDIGTLSDIITLDGDYEVSYTTTPDCEDCSGTVCTASSANVSITCGEETTTQILTPGEETTLNGNVNTNLTVVFVNGQASSASCSAEAPMMTGPQAISNFIITIVPVAEVEQVTEEPATISIEE